VAWGLCGYLENVSPYSPPNKANMKIIFYILLTLLVCMILAVSCQKPIQTSRSLNGFLWNCANASVGVWNYFNGSIREPIWNPSNPCYVECSTFTGPSYAPEGTLLYRISDTASYNPVPFCWNCHGGGTVWGYNSTTTGMSHAAGNPVTYGE
jgi:hypothetical protein